MTWQVLAFLDYVVSGASEARPLDMLAGLSSLDFWAQREQRRDVLAVLWPLWNLWQMVQEFHFRGEKAPCSWGVGVVMTEEAGWAAAGPAESELSGQLCPEVTELSLCS